MYVSISVDVGARRFCLPAGDDMHAPTYTHIYRYIDRDPRYIDRERYIDIFVHLYL